MEKEKATLEQKVAAIKKYVHAAQGHLETYCRCLHEAVDEAAKRSAEGVAEMKMSLGQLMQIIAAGEMLLRAMEQDPISDKPNGDWMRYCEAKKSNPT